MAVKKAGGRGRIPARKRVSQWPSRAAPSSGDVIVRPCPYACVLSPVQPHPLIALAHGAALRAGFVVERLPVCLSMDSEPAHLLLHVDSSKCRSLPCHARRAQVQ